MRVYGKFCKPFLLIVINKSKFMNNSNTLKNLAMGLIIALISYTTLCFIELKDE